MKNLIETGFDLAQREEIISLLRNLEQRIAAGVLPALTPEQRRKHGLVNERNKLMVNKVREYQHHTPTLSSPDVDWAEYERDYQMRAFYEDLTTRMESLAYQLGSAKILHDSDNYSDALADYAYTQYKSSAGAAGAAEKVADLKQFFARTGKVSNPPNLK